MTDLAQDIRVGFYDGVTPGGVALDGGVHQPQAKAHIQHISTPTTDSLQMQQTFAISASKGSTTCVAVQLKGLSCKGQSAFDSPPGSHISVSVTNEGHGCERIIQSNFGCRRGPGAAFIRQPGLFIVVRGFGQRCTNAYGSRIHRPVDKAVQHQPAIKNLHTARVLVCMNVSWDTFARP